jgi:acetyl coenzyme A synthetase (ADP forming)-like protein
MVSTTECHSSNITIHKSIKQISYFFNPKSVAVIGASSVKGKIGYEILRSLLKSGFKGKVFPINPNAQKILNVKCYSTVREIVDRIDLAVIALSAKLVPNIIEQCGKKGVKACVIVSGGFKELGIDFKENEDKIVEIAHKYGIRIIGPNCIGIFSSETNIDTFFQSNERMIRPPRGPISFITQSGTFGCTMLEWAAESKIGMSKFVSYGNRADVDETELIQYLGCDPFTKVIAVYVEGLGNGRKFLNAAKVVIPRKPIVVLKSGRTTQGSNVALSHTGALAGSYPIYKAALKQFGIIIADNFAELYDMTKALSLQPPAEGNRIAMVTNGAGPCVMAVDECIKRNLNLATFTPKTKEKLKTLLPSFCIIHNPVDLTGSATSHEYKVSMELILKDSNVDLLIVFLVLQDTPLDDNIVNIIPKMQRWGKPVICCASGGPYTRTQSRKLETRGIPTYSIPERAISASLALIKRGHILKSIQ